MSDNKQCPLCGKPVNDDDLFCEDCKNHVDNQYSTNLLDEDNFASDEKQNIEDLSEGKDVPSNESVKSDDNNSSEVLNDNMSTNKKGLSKGIIFVLIGAILIVIVGSVSVWKIGETRKSAENEELFWINSVEENTPVSYAKYLVSYPEGRYAEEAATRIREIREAETLAWEKLKRSADINDYYAYLSENPNTPHINQIRILMDSLSWQIAEKEDTEESYKTYINNTELGNIKGEHRNRAEQRYTYLSQIVTLEGAALDSVKTDIKNILKVLSANDTKGMLSVFADRTAYCDMDTTNTAIIEAITKEYKDKKIQNINHTLKSKPFVAKRDNAGLLFIDMGIDKEVIYTTKVKVGRKTQNKKEQIIETVKLQLDTAGQIRSIIIPTVKK